MQRGQKFTVVFLPTLLCLLAMLVGACGSSPSTPGTTGRKAPASKQDLRWDMGDADIATFDPALSQDTASDFAIKAVFTGLVEFDHNLKVVDQLAASHQVSTDGLTYTFTLKPNLKFSDGTALTSKDVVYSINRTLLPATKSPVAYYLQLIKDYDKVTTGKIPTLIGDSLLAPDDNTVKIIISQPAAYFLSALTYDCAYVVEQSLITKYQDNWTEHLSEGGGAGPWKVTSWSHTKGIEFAPNPNYYGPKPQLQKLEYLQLGNADTNYKAYQANQVDHAGVPVPQLAAAKTGKDFHINSQLVLTYFSLNYLTKPFDNIKIRQAFALAIDRDLLNTTLAKNTVKPTWSFVPEGMPGYNPNIVGPDGVTSTAGDKVKAKQLLLEGLKEAGYANVAALPPIKFTYYAGSTTTSNVVAAIVQMWQTVLGVKVTTETVDFPKLIGLENASKNNANGLQMWRAGWQADYPDPQDWLSIFFAKNSDYNQFNYGQNKSSAATEQQAVQALLLKADVNTNPTERIQQYQQAEQQIINDAGVIPLWQPLEQVVLRTTVQGIVFNGLDIVPPDDWANIYISQ